MLHTKMGLEFVFKMREKNVYGNKITGYYYANLPRSIKLIDSQETKALFMATSDRLPSQSTTMNINWSKVSLD